MSMTELDAVRIFLAGLDLLGASLPIESEAHSMYVAERSTWVNYMEALEQDAPPWEPEPEPAVSRTWANVAPGDSVQAPDGEWYEVDSTSRIGHRVAALLKVGSGTVRTERLAAERVPSRRGPEGKAMDVFAAGGLTLERIGR